MNDLVPVSNLLAEIRSSKDLGRMKEVAMMGETLRNLAIKAKKGLALQNACAEVKIKAERRCGEILAQEVPHGGDRKTKSRFARRTLKDYGISKHQSHRWKKIAAYPEEMFESHIAQAKEAGKELTSEGVYKLSKEHLRSLKIDQLKPIPDVDQLRGYIRMSFIEGDFRNCADSFDQVDAIITDPPYAKSVVHLYEDLARFAAQVLKPGGSLITMAGGAALPQIYESMSRHIDYHWTIAYHMPAHLVRMYQEKVACAWKPILWFVKGKRDGVKYSGKWTIDVIKAGHMERGLHKWQQSESGIDKLIKVVTRPGDIVLDPFMGSGTFLAAALRLNRRIIGIEIDPVASKTAETRLYKLARRITNPHLY